MAQTLRFVESWSIEDVYARFGTAGIDAQRLLSCQLTTSGSAALVAVHVDDVVGLLDYVCVADEIHMGIVVDSRFRKRQIGTALVLTLLRVKAPEYAVVAECRMSNRPAIALLRGCSFEPAGGASGEMTWRRDSLQRIA